MMRIKILLGALGAGLCLAVAAQGQLVYMTSLDGGNTTFAVYDVVANQWTPLRPFDTGAQMAVSAAGDLYALRRNPPMVQRYNPGDDTWTDVTSAPPGASLNLGNLEVTRAGDFFYSEADNPTLYYTRNGQWQQSRLPFLGNAMGDYDPNSDQYVIGEMFSGRAHMIDVNTLQITDFNNFPDDNGEWARFSAILNGMYYFQYGSLGIHSFDLSDPPAPAVDASGPYGAFYNAGAADRGSGVLYDMDLRAPGVLRRFDPVTRQFTPLAAFPFQGNHSSIAFVGTGGRCTYLVNKSKAKGECRTCPQRGDEYQTEQRCEDARECRKKVRTTLACPEGPGTCKIKANRDSCG